MQTITDELDALMRELPDNFIDAVMPQITDDLPSFPIDELPSFPIEDLPPFPDDLS